MYPSPSLAGDARPTASPSIGQLSFAAPITPTAASPSPHHPPAAAPSCGSFAWSIAVTDSVSPLLAVHQKCKPVAMTATAAAARVSNSVIAAASAAMHAQLRFRSQAHARAKLIALRIVRKPALNTVRLAMTSKPRPPTPGSANDNSSPYCAATPADRARGHRGATSATPSARLRWLIPSSAPMLPDNRKAMRPLSLEERKEARLWIQRKREKRAIQSGNRLTFTACPLAPRVPRASGVRTPSSLAPRPRARSLRR